MIGKIIKGKNPIGLFRYLLRKKDHNGEIRSRVAIIGGTFIGRSARELSREMEMFHEMRLTLGVHVIHMSLSAPEDERVISDDEWSKIAEMWCKEMGIDGYAVVRHGSDTHEHIHIAASRIKLNSSIVSDFNDYKKSESIVRRIEKEFNLKVVEASHLLEKDRAVTHRKAPTMAEIAIGEKIQKNKTTEKPKAELMRDILEMALKNNPTVSEFIDRLDASGVEVRPNIAKTGKLSGFSYIFEGWVFTATGLGRGFTFANMTKRGLDYEKIRDAERINKCNTRGQNQQIVGGDACANGVSETSSRESRRDQEAKHNTSGGHRVSTIAKRPSNGENDRGDKTSSIASDRGKSSDKGNDGLLRDENEKDGDRNRNKYAEAARDIIISTEKQSNSGRVIRISGVPCGNQRKLRNLSGLESGVSEIEHRINDAIRDINSETYNIDIEPPSGWIGRAPQSFTELTAEMISELIATLLRFLAMGCSVVIRGGGVEEEQTIRHNTAATVPYPANRKKIEYKYSPSSEQRPRRGPR